MLSPAGVGDALARRLAAMSSREQTVLAAGVAVLLLALVVGLAVLPAWRSLQQGPLRQQALDAQMARMVTLESQAQALQSRSRASGAEAVAKLQGNSAGLSDALQLSLKLPEQQAQATLRAMPAEALAAWLTAAREQAQAVPTEARLTRGADAPVGTGGAVGAVGAVSPGGADRWSGTLVLRLPP